MGAISFYLGSSKLSSVHAQMVFLPYLYVRRRGVGALPVPVQMI